MVWYEWIVTGAIEVLQRKQRPSPREVGLRMNAKSTEPTR